jgi:hypothetical protein
MFIALLQSIETSQEKHRLVRLDTCISKYLVPVIWHESFSFLVSFDTETEFISRGFGGSDDLHHPAALSWHMK